MVAEIIDITKDMTLAEIGARHLDNFNLILKASKKYYFDHPRKAFHFEGQCVNAAMRTFGIDQLQMAAKARGAHPESEFRSVLERKIDELLKEKGVEVQRLEKPGEEQKAGFYFFHANEIAYWVSEVNAERRRFQGKRLILPRVKMKFFIRTNVPAWALRYCIG